MHDNPPLAYVLKTLVLLQEIESPIKIVNCICCQKLLLDVCLVVICSVVCADMARGSIPTGGNLLVWPWTFGYRIAWSIENQLVTPQLICDALECRNDQGIFKNINKLV